MAEILLYVKSFFMAIMINGQTLAALIGLFCFLLSIFLKTHISKYWIYTVSLIVSFVASYTIYWGPVWLGYSQSDQHSSWAPIFITMGVIAGITGGFLGLVVQSSLKELFLSIKKHL